MTLSGAAGKRVNSSRAGFLPIPLAHVPPAALEGIPVFCRTQRKATAGTENEDFALYRSKHVRFTEPDKQRLVDSGVKFLYIRMADHQRYRQQTESRLEEVVEDPAIALLEKAAIVYETSVELISELLSGSDFGENLPRLATVSRAVTAFTVNNPDAFTHVFAAAEHDFYTATHMVNVGTWMVPLAFAMGHHDGDELNRICEAGMLHDIGKLYLPEEVLNKKGPLSNEEWDLIKQHPELGYNHLKKYVGVDPLVLTVTSQHHERLDGSGYPLGLTADQIHVASKICAVVDSFDAMTAFRPFKERTMSVSQALTILTEDTPEKYDAGAVQAWIGLIEAVDGPPCLPAEQPSLQDPIVDELQSRSPAGPDKRISERFALHVQGGAHVLEHSPDGWTEKPGIPVTAHSISRSGLGLLAQEPVPVDEHVRVYISARGWAKEYVEGRVVRCRAYGDGSFNIGIAFTKLT